VFVFLRLPKPNKLAIPVPNNQIAAGIGVEVTETLSKDDP
jgi:hypothetical protein